MSKFESAQGVVEAVARNNKAFKLEGEADWFTVYRASQLNGAQKGDSVSFEFDEKVSGGKTFLNVQGDVEVSEGKRSSGRSSGSGGSERRSGSGRGRGDAADSGGSSAYVTDRGFKIPTFPVPADHPDRSIIRQNSLTQANAILATMARGGLLGDMDADGLVEEAIRLARSFEAYSTGEE